jgi:O-antigen/teichoic acid export membrane protein
VGTAGVRPVTGSSRGSSSGPIETDGHRLDDPAGPSAFLSPAPVGMGHRFSVTLGVNLGRALLNFSLGLLLARGLGPDDYGRFAFLWSLFAGIHQLLEVGSSQAFFTFISQRPRSRVFFLRYGAWVGMRLVVPVLIIGLLAPADVVRVFVEGELRTVAILAIITSFVQQHIWETIIQVAEAQRRTVSIQAVSLVAAGAHVGLIGLLFVLNNLSVVVALMAAVGVYFVASIVGLRQVGVPVDESVETESLGDMFRLFVVYCAPLVPYTLLGGVYTMADRWMLQRFGGSVEQAYFGVASQIASISLLATVSVLRIFWQEVAQAHSEGDLTRVRMLYRRVTHLLYGLTVVGAMLLLPWSGDIVRVLLGQEYLGGAPVLTVMLLYPVHQALGQISGTVLLATERVGAFSLVGGIFMLVSMGVAYLMLATPSSPIPGLGLGAVGLAIKLVGLQVVQVNVMMYLVSRLLAWPFVWVFQVLAPVTAAAVTLPLYWVVTRGMSGSPLILQVAVYLLVAGAVIGLLFLRTPEVFGIDGEARDMVTDFLRGMYSRWVRFGG